ncbi:MULTISPECIES: DinB family protein [Pedobacter]|uniref:DinB family protein n=1 Tax=Pedobacter TaxID=84567 RepID=UPI0012025E40|nr:MULTISPECIES: DinB family protein [Pedobacter]RZJ40031.1 MAG: DinB family protein [Chryseobacterium sp.]
MAKLEVWQRGLLPNLDPLLQPVGHALLQAQEELHEYLADFPNQLLWVKPAGMASVGFHLQHLSGVLDRVFTYARAEGLMLFQFEQLEEEGRDSDDGYTVDALVGRFDARINIVMKQLRETDINTLTDFRGIGRAGLPSTVMGLLFHGAEHTMRHLGQLMVTAAVVKEKFNDY